tara:strand:+ start:168 stop:686 length:519 start_codon:yes stop_codon:yes gene_type:complete
MKKIFLIIFFSLIQINFVSAVSEISFIDMDKLLSTSKPGQSILKQLKEINNQNLKDFQNQETTLKESEKKLISQKNIISVEDFDAKLNKLRIEFSKYNKNKTKKLNELKQLRIDNTNKFLEQLNPILINYSKKNSISLILQKKNLIIGKSELDITDEVLKEVNRDMSEFKIK